MAHSQSRERPYWGRSDFWYFRRGVFAFLGVVAGLGLAAYALFH